MSKFKSGFVAIIGRPNVGKSTLLNKFLNQKIAIVTPKAQTTRNRIQGIYTTENEQIIFVDTPGIHKPRHELGITMNKAALGSLEGMDVICLLSKEITLGPADQMIIEYLKAVKTPVILVINKVDLVKDQEALKENITHIRRHIRSAVA